MDNQKFFFNVSCTLWTNQLFAGESEFFQNFCMYLNLEAHNSGFQPSLRKEVRNKNILFHFRTGQKYNKDLNFWVYCYCSSNKTDMV